MYSALEQRHPRIAAQLAELWNEGAPAVDYLDRLLFTETTRENRHGFGSEVWLELMLLHEVLQLEHPRPTSGLATDIWAAAADAGPIS